jgi:hypothetical protein
MTPEEMLTDISADLLAEARNRLFLERLLSEKPGTWFEVGSLVGGLGTVEERLRFALQDLEGPVRVTWLDYPESAYGSGYCVIVFFCEYLNWSQVAIYNANLIRR